VLVVMIRYPKIPVDAIDTRLQVKLILEVVDRNDAVFPLTIPNCEETQG